MSNKNNDSQTSLRSKQKQTSLLSFFKAPPRMGSRSTVRTETVCTEPIPSPAVVLAVSTGTSDTATTATSTTRSSSHHHVTPETTCMAQQQQQQQHTASSSSKSSESSSLPVLPPSPSLVPLVSTNHRPSSPLLQSRASTTMVVERPKGASMQQRQEEEEENDVVDDDSISRTTRPKDNVKIGLSDYELLRLRNIERNNARLAALGLLSTTTESVVDHRARPRMTKKRPLSRVPSTAPVPTRRSTRRRQRDETTADGASTLSPTTNSTVGIMEPDPGRSTALYVSSTTVPMLLPGDETYEVSPLFQYTMTAPINTTQTSGTSQHHYDGSVTSLVPLSKRLNPTMGAIYSLHFYQNWLVGAGKAGMIAIWDHTTTTTTLPHQEEQQQDFTNNTTIVDPVLSWKAHAGRWVAEVRFIANGRRLLTAANDGCVCIWDVTTVSTQQQIPKCLSQTGKGLHTSGIFALDVLEPTSSSSSNVLVATASKDKTVQLSILDQTWGWWKSDHHSAKVGDVRFKGTDSSLLASVGDDGLVVVHDYKSHRIVAESSTAHQRPHSVAWHPTHEHVLLTAGHDRTIKLWDIRRFGGDGGGAVPLGILEGHVPVQETRCKRIHRPVWYQRDYVLTGGQSSHALSAFHTRFSENQTVDVSMMWRGRLPEECGDAGCIAVDGSRVAVSTEGAEILLLEPSTTCGDVE